MSQGSKAGFSCKPLLLREAGCVCVCDLSLPTTLGLREDYMFITCTSGFRYPRRQKSKRQIDTLSLSFTMMFQNLWPQLVFQTEEAYCMELNRSGFEF